MADRFRTALDWGDIRVFATLAPHGSLSATARALGVNHATVARRLAGLEQALGSKLFERRSKGYQLTTAGRRVLEPAAAMENAAGASALTLPRASAPPKLSSGNTESGMRERSRSSRSAGQ